MKRTFPALMALSLLALWSAYPFAALAQEDGKEICEKFDSLFPHNKVSSVNDEDRRTNLSLSTLYTDASNEKLYGLLSITSNAEHYKAIIELYPNIDLLLLVPDVSRPTDFPKEINDFIAPLTWIKREKWRGSNSFPNYKSYEMCDPLSYFIPGEEFDDGKHRRFIRHYPFGKRNSIGNKTCESWGNVSDQLRFYEAFAPHIFSLKSGRVYIDDEYAGLEVDGEFKYVCGLGDFVAGREKVLAQEPTEPIKTREFLVQRGFVDAKNFANSWELQVLRNLIEGSELYNK